MSSLNEKRNKKRKRQQGKHRKEMRKQYAPPKAPVPPKVSGKYALPFLTVLAILTVAAFIIPLRPTMSEREKRELTAFPSFTREALLSGEYFDDITLWFSDTFPGRETWLDVADFTESLHGYSEISVVDDENIVDQLLNGGSTQGESEYPEITPMPTPTPWGGVDAGEGAEVHMGKIIQIGDSAFNRLGYSKTCCEDYAASLNHLAELLKDKGVRVISAPAPTAIGVMVEAQYMKKLNSVDPAFLLEEIHGRLNDKVIGVDTVTPLRNHNSEYIYFRTDHHWTALGAYYAYAAVCEELGMEPADINDFTVSDRGEFKGTHTSKVARPQKLKADTLYAYLPPQEIQAYVEYKQGPKKVPLIKDIADDKIFSKYLTFLGGAFELLRLENPEIQDGSTCLILKDSYGNAFAPFVTQNYQTVYVMDYRSFHRSNLSKFVEKYEVDDIWLIPYMIATQSLDGRNMFERLCK